FCINHFKLSSYILRNVIRYFNIRLSHPITPILLYKVYVEEVTVFTSSCICILFIRKAGPMKGSNNQAHHLQIGVVRLVIFKTPHKQQDPDLYFCHQGELMLQSYSSLYHSERNQK